MSLFELIESQKSVEPDGLTNYDLAVLADWAGSWKNTVIASDWKRAYALIREGADLLLRRRTRSSVQIIEKCTDVTDGVTYVRTKAG